MKIIVTGGAGFIGSHLCERLVQEGHEVHSLDNYFTGTTKNHVQGVNYISGNTKDINNLTFIPDMIYHLGEYSRVESSFDDIEKVIQYNKIGTFSILEFCRKHEVRLIYAGSSTKFCDNGEAGNSSPYSWSKSSNTQLVKNYGLWYGLDYAITYFYNVYGPREISTGKYATLIALFKEKIKNGESLSVVLPGTQRRNFTHIDDIINGLILVGYYGSGDEYGIGSDESYSVIEVAKLFGGDIEYLPERKGNRFSGPVVSDKTKLLGWKTTKKLEDYVEDYIKEYAR